ncbi:hypothetical protein J0H58_37530 [bacterium]|nr:hypothetical protein [bacterium]
MSRVFSVPTVLRMLPHDLLRAFLARLGHPDLPVPWDDLHARDPGPVVRALAALPAAAFDAVEAALHAVHDLACESGMAAIREAADPGDGGPPGPAAADMPDAGLYPRAVWAWLNHPDVVARAVLLHHVDHLTW